MIEIGKWGFDDGPELDMPADILLHRHDAPRQTEPERSEPERSDPDILLEERRTTAVDKALARCDDLERDDGTVRLLHDLVDEIHEYRPQDTDTGTYRVIDGGTAVETLMREGMTMQQIDEAARFGGWDRERDRFVRFNTDGDLTGLSSDQADQLVWEHRREIIKTARRDDELSQEAIARLERLPDPGRGSRGDFLAELRRRSDGIRTSRKDRAWTNRSCGWRAGLTAGPMSRGPRRGRGSRSRST